MKIIPTSGGYDSTLLLHKILESGESCAAHHVHLITEEGKRYAPEAKAYRAVLKELRRMHGDFICTTSTHKYFSPFWLGWDLLNATYHTAVATEGNLRHIGKRDVELCLAIPKESVRCDSDHDLLQDRVEDLWTTYFKRLGVHSTVSYPVSHMTKHEIIGALPENLRSICWTCRSPVDGTKPCGKCKSCLMAGGK
jgi:7-cyano-7-deazaguanine synthase in queuosine biosynthesis